MTSSTVAPQQDRDSTTPTAARRTVKDRIQQLLAFAGLIVVFAFFAVVSPNFLNYGNVTAILFSTVVIGTLALGTTFIRANFSNLKYILYLIVFILVTPVGIAIGIGVGSSYRPNSELALGFEGAFNSVSAGDTPSPPLPLTFLWDPPLG